MMQICPTIYEYSTIEPCEAAAKTRDILHKLLCKNCQWPFSCTIFVSSSEIFLQPLNRKWIVSSTWISPLILPRSKHHRLLGILLSMQDFGTHLATQLFCSRHTLWRCNLRQVDSLIPGRLAVPNRLHRSFSWVENHVLPSLAWGLFSSFSIYSNSPSDSKSLLIHLGLPTSLSSKYGCIRFGLSTNLYLWVTAAAHLPFVLSMNLNWLSSEMSMPSFMRSPEASRPVNPNSEVSIPTKFKRVGTKLIDEYAVSIRFPAGILLGYWIKKGTPAEVLYGVPLPGLVCSPMVPPW